MRISTFLNYSKPYKITSLRRSEQNFQLLCNILKKNGTSKDEYEIIMKIKDNYNFLKKIKIITFGFKKSKNGKS